MCCVWQLKLGMQLRGGMQITADKHEIVSVEKMSNFRRESCTKWLTYFDQPFREGTERSL